MKDVFTIIEKEGWEKSVWLKVGAAFENRDGSLTLFLDALPVNGRRGRLTRIPFFGEILPQRRQAPAPRRGVKSGHWTVRFGEATLRPDP